MNESPKKVQLWQPLMLAVMLAAGMVIGTQLDDELPESPLWNDTDPDRDWSELIDVVRFIEAKYGDTLDTDSIVNGAIDYLVDHLDPHSYYLSDDSYRYFKERMSGGYKGIGIEYHLLQDSVYLTWIYQDGPASKAGLEQGDIILDIDGRPISGAGRSDKEIWNVWKDTEASFQISYLDRTSGEVKEVTLTKAPIEVKSVPVGALFEDEIAYLKIIRFTKGTYGQFMMELEVLVEKGARHLIIDVRDNPGGSLSEVVKILDQLVLEKDQLLLYMEGENTKRTEHRSTGRVFYPIDKVVVLINEHSVSASEVLAGVLQDLGRAHIIGRRSFGKALVQEMYHLDDHAALNLTIGKYYLPSGRYIQRSYENRQRYEHELTVRIERGELFEQDSLKLDSFILKESFDGTPRPVGAGILPDQFVEASRLYYSDHWQKLKHSFGKASFQWFIDREIDSTNVSSMVQQDSILAVQLDRYIPPLTELPDLEEWRKFLRDQVTINFLYIIGREAAIVKWGKALDPTLMTGIRYLQSSQLRAQEN